jgi:hypothetical protein
MPVAGGPAWCAGWCDDFGVVVGTNRGDLHLYDLRKTGKDGGPMSTTHPFDDGCSGGWKKQPIVSIHPSANGYGVMSTLHEVGTVRMWGEGESEGDGEVDGRGGTSKSPYSYSRFRPWFKKEQGQNVKQLLCDFSSNIAVVTSTSSSTSTSSFRVFSDVNLSLRNGWNKPPHSVLHTTPASVLVKRPGMTTCSLQPRAHGGILLGTVDEKSGGMCVIHSETESDGSDLSGTTVVPFEKIRADSAVPVVAVMSWNLSKSRMCVMTSRADGRVDILAADHR